MLLRGKIGSLTWVFSLQICSSLHHTSLHPKDYCPFPFRVAFSCSKRWFIPVSLPCFPFSGSPLAPYLPGLGFQAQSLQPWPGEDKPLPLSRPQNPLPNLAVEHDTPLRFAAPSSHLMSVCEMAMGEAPVLLVLCRWNVSTKVVHWLPF